MTNTERTLNSIIKYCVGAPSHSALSTVYMLAVEALEEYKEEQSVQYQELRELHNRASFPNNDVGHGAG